MVNDLPHPPWKCLFVILIIVVYENEAIGRHIAASGGKMQEGMNEEISSVGRSRVSGLKERLEGRCALTRVYRVRC